jgi:Zn-finger nucleic acid-binding protein
MELICPKCGAGMRTYERNGIHIDQCTSCRGVFLDRGELEHLIDAEQAFYKPAPSQPMPTQAQPQYYYGSKKKKSLLGELFDF